MRFRLILNKTFYPTPTPLTYQQLKYFQTTNISKTMLSAFLSSALYTMFTIRIKKQVSIPILTVIERVLSVSEFSTRISKLYAPAGSKHKLHKTKIKNWQPIEFNLESSRLGTHSHDDYTMFN